MQHRRILFTILLSLACLGSFAQSYPEPDILSGYDFLKTLMESNDLIYVEFDWDKCQYDYETTLKEELGEDYEDNIIESRELFVESFNHNTKKKGGPTLTEYQEDAKYKLLVTLDNVDIYWSLKTKGHSAKLWGTISITSVGSGEKLAELLLDEIEFPGGIGTARSRCIRCTFSGIGYAMPRQFRKL